MTQLVQTINQYIDTTASYINWQNILDWYEQHLSRFTNTKTKRITITAAVLLTYIGHSIYRKFTPPKKLSHIPHLSAITTLKNLIVKKTPTHLMMRDISMPLVEKYGLYQKYDRTGWVVHVCTPEAVKQVFLKSDIFPKQHKAAFGDTINAKYLGGSSNILFEVGAPWKKHRMLANPAFHKAQPVQLFGDLTRQLFNVWEQQYPSSDFVVNFTNAMERLTLEIIGKAGFGFDFNAIKDERSEWKLIYDESSAAGRNPLYLFFPVLDKQLLWLSPERQKQHKTVAKFGNMLESMIEKKRNEIKNNIDHGIEESEKDLLTLMIESEFRGEGVLTNKELLADLSIFFAAGHDTTANALSCACYYLAKHPDIQEKARQEVNNVLFPNGEEPRDDIIPTIEQTKQFVYLNQVMKETLRMNGSVVALISPRQATQDTYLNDFFIPKGTLVNINMYDLHHNPTIWKNPEEFNPDRFSPGGEAESRAGGGFAWVSRLKYYSPFLYGSM
ncbi:unnamed protein product [Cunninghamella blakesleeana]